MDAPARRARRGARRGGVRALARAGRRRCSTARAPPARSRWPNGSGEADDHGRAHGRARVPALAGRSRSRPHPPARVPRRVDARVARTSRSPTPTRPTGCRPSCSRWPPRAPGHEVVCEAEYALARDAIGAAGPDVIVNGPVKSDALLERAAADGALVVVDSEPELTRAARAGVERVGLRVALPGIGVEPTRFGIAPGLVPEAAARARALGLELEALSAHLVSTGFDQPLPAAPRLGAAITVQWPPAARRARGGGRAPGAAGGRARRGRDRPRRRLPGGAGRRRARGRRRRRPALHGFAGRLILEPGRALVTDAAALAFSVVAVKRLDDGTRCVVVDAGTNLLPGALWSWPRIEAHRRRRAADGAGARQRPAVPERRRPAPGRASCPTWRRATPCSCATPAPISRRNRPLRRPAPRGGRPRRRPLAGLPAA